MSWERTVWHRGMRLLTGLVAATAAAVLCCEAKGDGVVPIPVVMWATQPDVLSGKNVYGGIGKNAVSQREVTKLIDRLIGTTEDTVHEDLVHLIPDTVMENDLVVVFMADQFSTAELSTVALAYSKEVSSGFQKTFQTSPSSAAIPSTFVASAKGVQTAWSEWFFSQSAKVRVELASDSVEQAIAAVEKALEERDGKPLVVLALIEEDSSDWSQAIAEFCEKLERHSSKYFAVLTGLNHKAAPSFADSPREAILLIQVERLESRKLAATTSSVIATSVSPTIFVGMIIGLVFFLTVFLYLGCMDTMTAPTRFVKRNPIGGKIFE